MRLYMLITFMVFVLIVLVVVKWTLGKGQREIDRNRVEPPDDEETP